MIILKRLYNLILIVINYLASIVTRKVLVSPYPFAISIEPTNYCQLHCLECPVGTNELSRPKAYMELSVFKSIIDSVYPYVFYLNLYAQGEPLLHSEIIEMISYARSKNFYVVLSTNGMLLDDTMAEKIVQSGLSKIVISMDGFSQQTYEAYRKGGELSRIKYGIEALSKIKKQLKKNNPKLVVQALVTSHNEHELNAIKEWVCSLNNVKFVKKSLQIYKNFNLLPKQESYKRYRFSENQWNRKKKYLNRCFRIWSQCVITVQGDVVPCCFDKKAQYVMGNVNNQSLNELWRNEAFQRFRKAVLENRRQFLICQNCTE